MTSATPLASHEKLFASTWESHTGSIFDISQCDEQTTKLEALASTPHKSSLIHAVFAKRANAVVTSSYDRTIRFRDLITFEQRGPSLRFLEPVEKISFDPLEQRFFTMHRRSQIIWAWKPPKTWANQIFLTSGDSRNIFFTSRGDSASALMIDKKTESFSVEATDPIFPEEVFRKSRGSRSSTHLIANPARKSFLIIDPKIQSIHEIHEETSTLLNEYKGISGTVTCSSVSANGRYLALVSKAGSRTTVLDLERKTSKSHSNGLQGVTSIEFSPENEQEVIVSYEDTISWMNWKTGKIERQETFGEGEITDLGVYPAKGLVAVGSSDRTAMVFKESQWEPISPIIQHEERVSLIKFVDEGRFIVTGEKNNQVRIWDVSTGTPIGPPLTHNERILHIDVCDESNKILTVCAEGRVKIWPTPTLDEREFPQIRKWLENHVYTDF